MEATTPADLQKCFEANSMSPFFALKYGPPAMAKMTSKRNYPNAAPKDQKYGSIVVVSSVASTYGGEYLRQPRQPRHQKQQLYIRILQRDTDHTLAKPGCWGPCYTMTSHAALGVVRAGVTALKGPPPFPSLLTSPHYTPPPPT